MNTSRTKKIVGTSIAVAAGAMALSGALNIKLDPTKGLSLQALNISVGVPKASANCSDNHSGNGNCVC